MGTRKIFPVSLLVILIVLGFFTLFSGCGGGEPLAQSGDGQVSIRVKFPQDQRGFIKSLKQTGMVISYYRVSLYEKTDNFQDAISYDGQYFVLDREQTVYYEENTSTEGATVVFEQVPVGIKLLKVEGWGPETEGGETALITRKITDEQNNTLQLAYEQIINVTAGPNSPMAANLTPYTPETTTPEPLPPPPPPPATPKITEIVGEFNTGGMITIKGENFAPTEGIVEVKFTNSSQKTVSYEINKILVSSTEITCKIPYWLGNEDTYSLKVQVSVNGVTSNEVTKDINKIWHTSDVKEVASIESITTPLPVDIIGDKEGNIISVFPYAYDDLNYRNGGNIFIAKKDVPNIIYYQDDFEKINSGGWSTSPWTQFTDDFFIYKDSHPLGTAPILLPDLHSFQDGKQEDIRALMVYSAHELDESPHTYLYVLNYDEENLNFHWSKIICNGILAKNGLVVDAVENFGFLYNTGASDNNNSFYGYPDFSGQTPGWQLEEISDGSGNFILPNAVFADSTNLSKATPSAMAVYFDELNNELYAVPSNDVSATEQWNTADQILVADAIDMKTSNFYNTRPTIIDYQHNNETNYMIITPVQRGKKLNSYIKNEPVWDQETLSDDSFIYGMKVHRLNNKIFCLYLKNSSMNPDESGLFYRVFENGSWGAQVLVDHPDNGSIEDFDSMVVGDKIAIVINSNYFSNLRQIYSYFCSSQGTVSEKTVLRTFDEQTGSKTSSILVKLPRLTRDYNGNIVLVYGFMDSEITSGNENYFIESIRYE
ncbi:MAG: IPT/TIG domain-containing protein [Vulcanimicrobiota bacterium]